MCFPTQETNIPSDIMFPYPWNAYPLLIVQFLQQFTASENLK